MVIFIIPPWPKEKWTGKEEKRWLSPQAARRNAAGACSLAAGANDGRCGHRGHSREEECYGRWPIGCRSERRALRTQRTQPHQSFIKSSG